MEYDAGTVLTDDKVNRLLAQEDEPLPLHETRVEELERRLAATEQFTATLADVVVALTQRVKRHGTAI